MTAQAENATQVAITTYAASDWCSIAPIWRELAALSPYTTYFITADWVEAWLEVFGNQLSPEVLVFRAGEQVIGSCLIVSRTHKYRFIPVNRRFINTSGEREGSPFIEFNNLLALEGWEAQIAAAVRCYVTDRNWDELALDGFCPGAPLEAFRNAFADANHERDVKMNYYVDLDAVREKNAIYEAALGYKTRKHLRQAYKMYGDIVTECAGTVDTALSFLDELAALHQQHWTRWGEPGAFASPLFGAFHRSLIRRTFGWGGIQMLKFSTGDSVIGLMYNFVYHGKVYFYQSGLAYSENKRFRPGFVGIGKAVQYCLEQPDLKEFHLMPTGDHYKSSMGTNSHQVEWLLVRKPNVKSHTIDMLRSVSRKLRAAKTESGTTVADAGSENDGD